MKKNINVIMPTKQETRPLHVIANEIRQNWRPMYFGAVPYVEAMATMDSIDSQYGYDSGDSIVRYFLGNAQTWRGEVAKRVKNELRGMLR